MGRLGPGLTLAVGVGAAAWLLAGLEARVLGSAVLDALVLAILLGIAVRSGLRNVGRFAPGIETSAKSVLEVAVLLLGASVDVRQVATAGAALIAAVVAVVAVALASSYAIARAFGLSHALALLVAAGNAVCGNSAIAALAPVIGARRDDIASAIAITALLAVVVVIALPLLAGPLGLDDAGYGIFAGLTVYAVPHVLAAAFPISPLAGQVATLVKLLRVLLLGPVVVALSLFTNRRTHPGRATTLGQMIPWFIVGFLGLAACRTLGFIGAPAAEALAASSRALTLVAMAALGLGVDLGALRRVGGAVAAAVALSLLALGVLAYLAAIAVTHA